MIELYTYDAGKGDCLRIRFQGKSGAYHNILVDSGTIRFGKTFATLCQEFSSAGETIDMLLITHVDEDHLGGLLYMVRHDIPIRIDMVVMNHPCNPPIAGGIADTLLSLPQNDEIFRRLSAGGVILRNALRGETISIDGAQFHILHPIAENLENLFGIIDPDVPLRNGDDRNVALDMLAEDKLPSVDTHINNAASIVFVFEYAGKRLLFTGDAKASDILDGIRSCDALKWEKTPLNFDAVKLPHHGSARNISEEWPNVIQAERYVICADGRRHPDKQTIAKLLKWYESVTIISACDWWNNGYFTQTDKEQYIKPEKLHLCQAEKEGIIL